MGQKKSKKSVGAPICSNDGENLSPRGEESDDNNQVGKIKIGFVKSLLNLSLKHTLLIKIVEMNNIL